MAADLVPAAPAALEAAPHAAPAAIPVRDLLPWATFAALVTMLLVYFVGAEQGAAAVVGGSQVHELVHDARHLLGFPCH